MFKRRMKVVIGKPTNYDELYNSVVHDIADQGITIDDDHFIKNPHKAIAQKLTDSIRSLLELGN